MADIVSLPASARERAGKGAARATRRAGQIPAVVYGSKETPTLIALDPKTLKQQLSRSGFFTRLIDVDVEGKKQRVLPRDVQYHPVTDQPIHVDFMRVAADATVTVSVPVMFVNETASPGLKKGGVLNIVRHEVDLLCHADSIPPHLTVDLTGREIGDSIHISMIALPSGVRPTIADRDFTIATVAAPTVQTEEEVRPTAAAEAAPAERKPVPAAPGGAAAPKAAAAKAPAKK
ncbi:MAG TPA: 50S ribosomal protein L25/general stress protein Ctc [Alphaproteobacteria bacterium]|jgi:large subunit ribosomal protein L25